MFSRVDRGSAIIAGGSEFFEWREYDDVESLENMSGVGDIAEDDNEVFTCVKEERNCVVRVMSVGYG
jgi:hypothetical protein